MQNRSCHSQVAAPLEFAELRALSARVGRDPLLTQGTSGNTSIKIGENLWIKASGTWLADADQEDVFVPINLELIRKCLRENLDFPDCGGGTSSANPRPSVETAMHAVLPYRVVMHVHSVNAIAAAVRSDAEQLLRTRLYGLPWAWVPYVASGRPLAIATEHAQLGQPGAQIFVLGNHGLVIGGQSCPDVANLLQQVEARLAVRPRSAAEFNESSLREIANRSGWMLPRSQQVHALGTDPMAQAILSAGVLYPCQAIFLHGSKPWRSSCHDDFAARDADREQGGPQWPFLILKGQGVLVSEQMSDAEYETLAGLAEVVLRLVNCCPLRYLTTAETSSTGGFYRSVARSSRAQASQSH